MKKFVSLFGEQTEIFEELNKKAATYAKEKNLDYVWVPQQPFDQDNVIRTLQGADVGLIDIQTFDNVIFSQIKEKCRLLVRFGVGFDAVNLKDATENGICITRTTGANSMSVAEMALSMIMAAQRQHVRNQNAVKEGVWVKNVGNELHGKKIGILGFGAIGRKFAEIVRGFEPKLYVYDPMLSEKDAESLGVRRAEVDEIFSECDAITIHVPYNKETHHLVNKTRLDMMKKTAVVVCTARGNIVDEMALYEALKCGQIAGAGLDVFSIEPLPKDSRLMELDNLILTPHVSSQTYEALWGTYKKAIDIAADFFDGKELGKGDLLNPDYMSGRQGKDACS